MTTAFPGEKFLHNSNAFFIGGRWERASTENTFEVINPTTEETFARVAAAQEEDLRKAVAAARQAFDVGPWPMM